MLRCKRRRREGSCLESMVDFYVEIRRKKRNKGKEIVSQIKAQTRDETSLFPNLDLNSHSSLSLSLSKKKERKKQRNKELASYFFVALLLVFRLSSISSSSASSCTSASDAARLSPIRALFLVPVAGALFSFGGALDLLSPFFLEAFFSLFASSSASFSPLSFLSLSLSED